MGCGGSYSDDLKVFRAEKPEMVVHSPHLCAALSAVVGYYPNFNCLAEGTVIPAPYEVLYHHWKDLERYKDNQPESHDAEYAAVTAKHIDVLLAFLELTFSEKLEEESARWNNPSGGTATFDLFWLLLKPGEVIYKERDGYFRTFIISSVVRNEGDRGQETYTVVYWDIGFQHNRLRRRMHSSTIPSWNGERVISTLPIIPARFVPGGENAMEEKQIELGKQYWELSKQPSYREYIGMATDREGRRQGTVSVLPCVTSWTNN
jgi:hypothetical protein